MKPEKKTKTCPDCLGEGRESDTSMSLVMGAAIGSGWWPMYRDCERCDGTGKVEDEDE